MIVGQAGRLQKAFNYFDKDKSGKLSVGEMLDVLTRATGQSLDIEDAQGFIAMFDRDGDGQIDFREFVQSMDDAGLTEGALNASEQAKAYATAQANMPPAQKLVQQCKKTGREFALVAPSGKTVLVNMMGIAKAGSSPGSAGERFTAIDVGGGMVGLKNTHTGLVPRWLGVDLFGTTNSLAIGYWNTPPGPLWGFCKFKVEDHGNGMVKFTCPAAGNKPMMKSIGSVFSVEWC